MLLVDKLLLVSLISELMLLSPEEVVGVVVIVVVVDAAVAVVNCDCVGVAAGVCVGA